MTEAIDTRKRADGYFGLCPHCHNHDGHFAVGTGSSVTCTRPTGASGARLYSSDLDETEEQQREKFYKHGFDKYEEVEPWFHPEDVARREAEWENLLKRQSEEREAFLRMRKRWGLPFRQVRFDSTTGKIVDAATGEIIDLHRGSDDNDPSSTGRAALQRLRERRG